MDASLDVTMQATPSKSDTHRALTAAALAHGRSTVIGPLVADDTRVTRAGLEALGVSVDDGRSGWIVEGRGGRVDGGASLDLRQSGTSMRFLLALSALGSRPTRLDGDPRLRDRPLEELVVALRELGADCTPSSRGGLPAVAGGRLPVGGAVRIRADRSSQFASALLAIGSVLERGLDLTLAPPVVSMPYIEMTVATLRGFGARIESRDGPRWIVRPSRLRATDYRVEGDHSSASYFLAAAAILGGRVRVMRLDPNSLQPDARLASFLSRAGCRVRTGEDWVEVSRGAPLTPVELDLGACPDIVPTLAVVAMTAPGRSVFHNVAHLRLKESDRLQTVSENIRRMGGSAEVEGDRLIIGPSDGRLRGATIETAGDHRIAMAFAVSGLAVAGVSIDDSRCVEKSNPDFWRQLEALG
jgi:3-phosphoshikimate 1-carboxyvinyltransferase